MHKNNILTPFFLLFFLVVVTLPAAGEEDYLPPEQAFRILGEPDGPDAVRVTWEIAGGYYLYRSKIKFASETPGIKLGDPDLPEGKIKHDEFFGDVEVYHSKVSVRIPLKRGLGAGETLALKVTSQGCAEAGLCYPPQHQILLLQLPAIPAAPAPTGGGLDLLTLLNQSSGLGPDGGVPPSEQAFRFLAEVEAPDRLRLRWQIADAVYLYQEKIKLALKVGDGVALGDYQLPPPQIRKDAVRPDGTVGDLPVYDHDFDLMVPLVRSVAGATEIQLEAQFQGCADQGVCYPVRKELIHLTLPPLPATIATTSLPDSPSAATGGTTEPVPEQDRMVSTLAGGPLWLILVLFFGAGLALALTPCIFPMIPILTGIIVGQGAAITTRRAFVLSLVYVLAMAAIYTILGVLAGLFGQNLQAMFQNPWVLGSFAAIFVLLAFSMFGFYELQLPSALQSRLSAISNRQRGGSLLGVGVMGSLSALIVGPCVAPPLAAVLIYIGQTGDGALGGMALFALSMGMGTPLLIIGTSAGKLLPRAGGWMDAIKSVFGVGMLAVAIILLERIVPAAITMVLGGTLLVVSAIYMGALRNLPIEATGWQRFWKGMGVVLMIYGTLMLVGAASGGRDIVQPLRSISFAGGGGEVEHLVFKRIKTVADLEREVQGATAQGRPVMLDFYADWCISCKELERYTFSDPAVIAALQGVTLLQADVTANDEADHALLQGHFGLPGPPSIIFYGRDGRERRNYRVVGFIDAESFAQHVIQAVQ